MTHVLFIQGAGAGVHEHWDRPLVERAIVLIAAPFIGCAGSPGTITS